MQRPLLLLCHRHLLSNSQRLSSSATYASLPSPPPLLPPPHAPPPASTPVGQPFRPPATSSAFLSLLQLHNRRLEWSRSRDLFLRCRSVFPLTEDIADAALLALSHLSIPQTFHSFQLFTHHLHVTSPRLYNRMLAMLYPKKARRQKGEERMEQEDGGEEEEAAEEREEEEDADKGGGVEAAERLLERMQLQGVPANAETAFHLSCIYLAAGRLFKAAAHYDTAHHLLQQPAHAAADSFSPPSPSSSSPPSPPPSPLHPLTFTAADMVDLFRGFVHAGHLPACRLLLADFPSFGIRIRPWHRNALHTLAQEEARRTRRIRPTAAAFPSPSPSVTPSSPPPSSAPSSTPSASQPLPAPSPSTFRVGLERKAPVSLPDVVLPLDAVDPLPPPLPLPPPYPTRLHLLLEPSFLSSAPFSPSSLLHCSLLRCYHTADVPAALQIVSHPPSPLTSAHLHVLLLVLTTHLPSAPPAPTLPFHQQISHALEVACLLREQEGGAGDVDVGAAMLLLRALAYTPFPLPSSSHSQALLPPHLSADAVAREAALLHSNLISRIDPSHTAALALISSLHLRAQVKTSATGTRAALSLPSPPSPQALPYLLYHHVHLPVTSLQQAYHLLASHPSTPHLSSLPLYFLLCGHLLRQDHSKARAIYKAAVVRYQHAAPPQHMTDAMLLGHRGAGEQQEEAATEVIAEVLEEMRKRGVRGKELHGRAGREVGRVEEQKEGEGPVLEAGRQAVEVWVESRMRKRKRRVGKRESEGVAAAREEKGQVEDSVWARRERHVAEALWLGLSRQTGDGDSAPAVHPLPPPAPLPLLLLTQLAVLLSSSPLFPSLLSHLLEALSSPPYLLAHSTEAALHASIELEHSLVPDLPSSTSSFSSRSSFILPPLPSPFSAFTRFASALSLIPFHSHAAFLSHQLLSRTLRTVVYSLAPPSTPSPLHPSTLSAILNLLHSYSPPSLDPLSYHILLSFAVAHSLPPPATLILYTWGKVAVAQTAGGAGEGQGGVGWLAGVQHLEVLRLIDCARRGEDVGKGMEWLKEGSGECVSDAAVLAAIDVAVSSRSPPLLLAALSALAPVLSLPPVHPATAQYERCPLPRTFAALTRGFTQALRGVLLHHWLDTALVLPPFYHAILRYLTAYYPRSSGIIPSSSPSASLSSSSFSSSSSSASPSRSPLHRWQLEVVSLTAALGVETNNLDPLMALYEAMGGGEGGAAKPVIGGRAAAVELDVMAVVMKAALLNGHRRRVWHLLDDVNRWSRGKAQAGGVRRMEQSERVNAQVEAAVRGTRFPIRRNFLTAPDPLRILSHYLSRLPLARLEEAQPAAAVAGKGRAAEGREGRLSSAGGGWEVSPAVKDALWAHRQLLQQPSVRGPNGVSLLSDAFQQMLLEHVKASRQREARRRATAHGKAEEEAGSGQEERDNIELVRLIEHLCDDAVLALIQHAMHTS